MPRTSEGAPADRARERALTNGHGYGAAYIGRADVGPETLWTARVMVSDGRREREVLVHCPFVQVYEDANHGALVRIVEERMAARGATSSPLLGVVAPIVIGARDVPCVFS